MKFEFTKRILPCLTIVLVAAFASNIFAQAVVYKAGTIHTMAGEPLTPGQILVEDGKIKAIGKSVKSGNAKTVDLGDDAVIMPGLIDAYSQAAFYNGGSADEITNEVTPNFKAVHSIDWSSRTLRRVLENGTTTVNACPGTQNVVAGISAIVKTDGSQESVMNDDAVMLASLCNDPASRNRSRSRPDSIYVRQPTNRMGVVWILRNTFQKTTKAGDDSELTNLKQVLDGKRKLMMVSRMSYDLNTIGSLTDEFDFSPIIVGGHEAYKIKSILAERKFPVILQSNPAGTTTGREGSELCWNNAGVLHQAGITVALSGSNLLAEAQFAHRHGLDRDVALAAVTSTPAKMLGIEQQVGTLEANKDADLIVLNGDPLEFTTSIRWVMVNGKTIGQKKDK
ncbi:MAG: amidohydrolase family protein [Planctomycetota bacterium]